eukprot:TRINITY_DN19_c0_g1_i2.p1 TRINITY_DN19_c0_g1~~TRINITY_DN19_c0_g1_i2.p1  ORF type:complete len:171 (-),score=66.06 TRINITY_DN19_c0_g1_i2:234-689(-)
MANLDTNLGNILDRAVHVKKNLPVPPTGVNEALMISATSYSTAICAPYIERSAREEATQNALPISANELVLMRCYFQSLERLASSECGSLFKDAAACLYGTKLARQSCVTERRNLESCINKLLANDLPSKEYDALMKERKESPLALYKLKP